MNRHHYVAAFDRVMNEIAQDSLPANFPRSQLRSLIFDEGFLVRSRDMLHEILDTTDWDWPAWTKFEKRSGRDAISDVVSTVSNASTLDLLTLMTFDELRAVASRRSDGEYKARSKAALVEKLMTVHDTDQSLLIESLRNAISARATAYARREKCDALCRRGEGVALGIFRTQQLDEFLDSTYLTHRGFIWCGHLKQDAPKACKRYDGMALPSKKAKQVFPTLPCNDLRCGCSITMMTTSDIQDWARKT